MSRVALAGAVPLRRPTASLGPLRSGQLLRTDLGTICLNTIAPADPTLPGFRLVTTSTTLQRRALDLLGVSRRLGVA